MEEYNIVMGPALPSASPHVAAPKLRVVEFYAGVGGWHCALQQSGVNAVIVAAIDINTTANQVYRHNFPDTAHHQRNICGLSGRDLDSYGAHVFTLSPPCQPFTRQGNQGDNTDRRTDSFFHLMHILPQMEHPPDYIMMENVKNFESSNTRHRFCEVLSTMGYSIQEFLLSPKQFGIPNSRLRYYLLAKRSSSISCTLALPNDPPCCTISDNLLPFCSEMGVTCSTTTPLSEGYIEPLTDNEVGEFLVADKTLAKYSVGMDIVNEHSCTSCCFTKGYAHYAVGTGSIFQHNRHASLDVAFKNFLELKEKGLIDKGLMHLKELQLRYFTPREVANLMCFPNTFTFPMDTTLHQRYKVLGNSVNVIVVGVLLKYLLHETVK